MGRNLVGQRDAGHPAAYHDYVEALHRDILAPDARDELTERDNQTLFELCARLLMNHAVTSSRQAVSQHIDVLVDAGLVVVRREGRYKFHRLDQRPLEHLADRWLRHTSEDQ